MAGVRYEMSIKSTFNGFRLQMLTSSVVDIDSCVFTKRVNPSISVNRIVAEYLPHHVHNAPRLGVYSATVHREWRVR